MQTTGAILRQSGLPRPYRDSKPLHLTQIDLDDPGPGELLVRIAAAGLCHSDLSVINGDRPRNMPLVLGHEAAGVVKSVGPHVTRFAPGDHVVLVFAPSCGHCLPCAEGRPALCEPAAVAAGKGSLISGGKRIHAGGEVIDHHIGVSAFAGHAVVAEASCVRIAPEIPLDRAALLGCAVLTGVGAVVNTGALRAGQSCAIVGLGGVGLAALLGAVAAGAGQIIAVDLSDEKLKIAQELGATHTVNPADPDALDRLRRITGGGVDLAVELAGAVPALEFAYEAARRGGTVVTAGLPRPEARLPVSPVTLTTGEKILRGSYMGSCVPVRDIPRYAGLMMAGKLPIDRLVTHELRLDQINEGFDRLADGSAIRQIIRF
ncbi:zinc-dependent alcohol dehydrogenase family protein [Paracoccus caeni]|uniref:Zinc-dependent alcohol dehydrogenase family protein n=1 Tax=Paracoccus caeni TaxID=657651 RepID=A0A934SFK7_9RHOB|nr:zinc-dependent alcohol dehydrogenase family protein [Paracoccus caeni]MBK4216086.1 zinc-dependent alcohol dehydrogenase family protein [Paracoccus caeni]